MALAHPTPVSFPDRIEALDVLRGFALLGILAMNIRGMAEPLSVDITPTRCSITPVPAVRRTSLPVWFSI